MAQSSRNTYPLMRDRQQLSAQRNSSSVATLRMPTAFWLEAEAVPFILHDSLPAALLVIHFSDRPLATHGSVSFSTLMPVASARGRCDEHAQEKPVSPLKR